jgi:hypothetical protein
MPVDESVLTDANLCEVVLGEALTAYLSGAGSVGQYRAWLRGDGSQLGTIANRLAAARRVILTFQIENVAGTAAAWLRGLGAASEVPADVIRKDGDNETLGTELEQTASKWLSDRRPSWQYAA